MRRTVTIGSHDVMQVDHNLFRDEQGLSRRPLALTYQGEGGTVEKRTGTVSGADYEELTNPNSPWFSPSAVEVAFRFTYEDGNEPSTPVDPSDPDYIPW